MKDEEIEIARISAAVKDACLGLPGAELSRVHFSNPHNGFVVELAIAKSLDPGSMRESIAILEAIPGVAGVWVNISSQ